jgi:exopolyphosphatase/guanosine-5'-triphosphate,3'-diphosphate pyrophosphatase
VRVAGIDCGTNSIRLLVASVQPDGSLLDLAREMRIVRLGQGVDQTGRLDPAAIERTRIALVEYAAIIASFGADALRMVATSATRDAANRDDFTTMVRDVLGIEPEVIAGADEAALSFAGAAGGVGSVATPLLVVDIGGGSTEIVLGSTGSESLKAYSMDIGCVRMTERHLRSDPPTNAQIEAARVDIRAAIKTATESVPIAEVVSFVGVAGTVTTMAAILLDLPEYDSAAIHGSIMRADQIRQLTDQLLRMPHDQRAAIPVMHPGRVDVIGAGALILAELVDASGVDAVIVSEHDILDAVTASARSRGSTNS